MIYAKREPNLRTLRMKGTDPASDGSAEFSHEVNSILYKGSQKSVSALKLKGITGLTKRRGKYVMFVFQ